MIKPKAALLPVLILLVAAFALFTNKAEADTPRATWWDVQSIDTMKYSRDMAREKLTVPEFDSEIEFQVKNIKELGATHIAIGTPYDEEFIPYLKRWVGFARDYDLKVWFRGNFSGWEEWFGYGKISKDEHKLMLHDFIVKNGDLFEDGDIFTSCPECENGSLGDPRQTRRVSEFRTFLVDEYIIASNAFDIIGKNVYANYYSMNGDVAKLVMDKQTAALLDSVIVVDHYVSSPQKLAEDVREYALASNSKVVLGEIGVPIPDIHGTLSDKQQAEWLEEALRLLSKEENLIGINYWVFSGGSTALFKQDGNLRPAAQVLKEFYNPEILNLKITNQIGQAIAGARVKVAHRIFVGDKNGNAAIAAVPGVEEITISSPGYNSYTQNINHPADREDVVLVKQRDNIFFRMLAFLRKLINR